MSERMEHRPGTANEATLFAGRRWVPAHRGAWHVERIDLTTLEESDGEVVAPGPSPTNG